MRRLLLAAFTALVVSACSNWVIVDREAHYVDPDGRFSVELPRDWLRLKGAPDHVWLTRDGLALQQVIVFTRPLEKALPLGKKGLSPDLLEHELADRQLGEFKKESEALAAARVIDRRPARLGGRSAFRLQLEWINDDGLPMARVAYGAVFGKDYLLIGYEAPKLHYFDRQLPAFEAMVASLRAERAATVAR